jgi:small subunit ribosomal protein S20
LAHSKSALKRWRQNEAHRARNKPVRTGARSAAKKARMLIATATPGNTDEAQAAIREAASVLDRAAKRKVIHPNAASRQKARLMRHLNQVAGAAPAEAEAPKRARKAPAKKAAAKKAPAKRATRAKKE